MDIIVHITSSLLKDKEKRKQWDSVKREGKIQRKRKKASRESSQQERGEDAFIKENGGNHPS